MLTLANSRENQFINFENPTDYVARFMPKSVVERALNAKLQELGKRLAQLEGKNASSPTLGTLPGTFNLPNPIYYNNYGQYGIAANETAKVWGDPHFVDADGGKFDVQGQAGKIYNLLNDTGLAFNATFEAAGNGTTMIGQTGITLSGLRGTSQIQYGKDGKTTLNGQVLQPGSMESLADGGTAYLSADGKTLTIKTGEGYTLTQRALGANIDADVKSPSQGVGMDGRMPGGLMGQTFDADKLARNSSGQQGEGAIEGKVQDYEVNGGVFGVMNPAIQKGVNPGVMGNIADIFSYAGLTPPAILPGYNPITGAPLNWNQIMGDQSLDFFLRQMSRQQILQQNDASKRKSDKLANLLRAVLASGNIDLAMLLIAQIETDEAKNMVTALTTQLQQAQQNRRAISQQMAPTQGQTGQPQQNMYTFQAGLQEANESIQMLTSLIKDVNDQKNRTVEFANNFLNSENQTTMSIVRGMRG